MTANDEEFKQCLVGACAMYKRDPTLHIAVVERQHAQERAESEGRTPTAENAKIYVRETLRDENAMCRILTDQCVAWIDKHAYPHMGDKKFDYADARVRGLPMKVIAVTNRNRLRTNGITPIQPDVDVPDPFFLFLNESIAIRQDLAKHYNQQWLDSHDAAVAEANRRHDYFLKTLIACREKLLAYKAKVDERKIQSPAAPVAIPTVSSAV